MKKKQKDSNTTKSESKEFKDYISELELAGKKYKYYMEQCINYYKSNKERAEKNKAKNILFKRIYTFVIALIPISIIAITVVYYIQKKTISFATTGMEYLICIIIPMFIAFSLAKWLDIKRYQETWARRRTLQVQLDNEAARYYYRIGDYKEDDKVFNANLFLQRSLALLDENVLRFNKNMSEHEKSLTDLPNFKL